MFEMCMESELHAHFEHFVYLSIYSLKVCVPILLPFPSQHCIRPQFILPSSLFDKPHLINLSSNVSLPSSLIIFHCVLGNAPSYLLELFILTSACSGRRSLRSASKGNFVGPHARTATRQKRAFSIVGPSVWNGLPTDLRSLPRDLSSSFHKLLKTLLSVRSTDFDIVETILLCVSFMNITKMERS